MVRCVLGLSGSVIFLSLIRWGCNKFSDSKIVDIIAKIGSMTLGIYCIQVIFAEGAFKHFATAVDSLLPYDGFKRIVLFDMVITPLAAVMTIILSYFTISQIRRSKYARLILLGEK